MSETVTAEQCAGCHREFNARSKPFWAFTTAGQPVGRVHTSCANTWPGRVSYSSTESLSAAQFWLWVRHFRPGEVTTPEWDVLGCLMLDPDEPWDDRHEEALRWLAEGVNKRDPNQVAAVRVAYHRLVEEFNLWRRPAPAGQEAGQREQSTR